ncbi:MAG: dihydropyrimidinase, partial [Hyphomicrobiales bacterium]|nr:dihydropyrimidinase [Hyphomicrobiales bacterium]
ADIAIWDPDRAITIEDRMMHDRAGYSPYAGRKLRGWPTQVLSRGRVVIEDGALKASPGTGEFLARDGGEAARPEHAATNAHDAAWRSYVL